MVKKDENAAESLAKVRRNATSRRRFIGTLGKTAAGAAAVAVAAPFVGGKVSVAEAANNETPGRMNDCFNYRKNAAIAQRVNVGPQEDNGDAARFTDFSGNFSKALLHDNLGVPNAAAWLALEKP